jgi:hypothetical protein
MLKPRAVAEVVQPALIDLKPKPWPQPPTGILELDLPFMGSDLNDYPGRLKAKICSRDVRQERQSTTDDGPAGFD